MDRRGMISFQRCQISAQAGFGLGLKIRNRSWPSTCIGVFAIHLSGRAEMSPTTLLIGAWMMKPSGLRTIATADRGATEVAG